MNEWNEKTRKTKIDKGGIKNINKRIKNTSKAQNINTIVKKKDNMR